VVAEISGHIVTVEDRGLTSADVDADIADL